MRRFIPASEVTITLPFSVVYTTEVEMLRKEIESCCAETVTLYFKKLVWLFPKDPFVLYESTDEGWCRALGIGQEIEAEDHITIPDALVSVSEDGSFLIRAFSKINKEWRY